MLSAYDSAKNIAWAENNKSKHKDPHNSSASEDKHFIWSSDESTISKLSEESEKTPAKT